MLYFTTDIMKTIVKNTNKYAAKQTKTKKYEWENIDLQTLEKFLGLLIYTSIVHLPCLKDYWRTNSIMSVPFPRMVMSWDRFLRTWWNIHLSDPEKDVEKDRLKGQPEHDIDIATTNAYIMHCELCESRMPEETPMSHKDFVTALAAALCGYEVTGVPTPITRQTQCLPVPIATPEQLAANPSKQNTVGRRECVLCKTRGKRQDTTWKCKRCNVALCLIVDRNCFREYHQ